MHYTLRFPHAQNHYVEVTAELEGPDPEFFLAVWTPGSYLIREYSQHLEGFWARGENGQELPWEKTRKNRWRVQAASGPITIGYRLYARTMGVQSNWVESGFALLNGAPTFLALVGSSCTYEVKLELPPSWAASYSGLESLSPNHFRARNYDHLVDSPIYAGSPQVYTFDAAGRKHYLVNEGEAGIWNGPESAQAVERIVREYHRMMGVIPYEQYLFFNLLLEASGGLEHLNSTVLITSRWAWGNTEVPPLEAKLNAAPREPNRSNWLDLVSHEYFHLWNVKRLRPQELGPFDYEHENYTRTLWVAEGITTYYGPLAVKRAGLIDRVAYLQFLSREITKLQNTPGRLSQPVETSSYDAWIKLYRQNENSTNTLISYYTKGAVIAWLIDARVQRLTGGSKSLDDVMRVAYQRYSGERGYTAGEFRHLVSEVAGSDLSAWFIQILETTDELDYSEALAWFGLRFAEPAGSRKAEFGAATKNDAGRLLVATVPRGTPAFESGLNVDDEILAINGFRVRPDALDAHLERLMPGDTIQLLVARREQLRTLSVILGPPSRRVWLLEPDPAASPKNLADWLRD